MYKEPRRESMEGTIELHDMIVSEIVQCPVCGEKDYILLLTDDTELGYHLICLSCGYDGSMGEFAIVASLSILTINVSDLAEASNTFTYTVSANPTPTNETKDFTYMSGSEVHLIIEHNYEGQPATLAVTIDDGSPELFMINEHETKEYTIVSLTSNLTIYIVLQSELPPT